jgi:hypothetical protein
LLTVTVIFLESRICGGDLQYVRIDSASRRLGGESVSTTPFDDDGYSPASVDDEQIRARYGRAECDGPAERGI